MPINRPDGRHWCAPEREEPDEQGQWTCPGCKTQWLYSAPEGYGGLWERREDLERRLESERLASEPLENKGDEV